MDSPGLHVPGNLKRNLVIVALVISALAAGASGFLYWQVTQQRSLLPETFARRVVDFTPYFYSGSMPPDYSFDQKSITFNNGILMVPINRKDGKNIILTEQKLPDNVTSDQLKNNGRDIANTESPAFVNIVEGRIVGMMLSKRYKTMVIFTAPGTMNIDDMTLLLQSIKPIL